MDEQAAREQQEDRRRRFDEARETIPGFAVESPEAFEEMVRYCRAAAEEGDEVHRFCLAGGEEVRCIDVATQHAARSAGLSAGDLQSGGDWPGAMRPGELARMFGMDGSRDGDGRTRACPVGAVPRLVPSLQALAKLPSLAALRVYRSRGLEMVAPPEELTLPPGPQVNLQRYHSVAGSKGINNLGLYADVNIWQPTVQPNGMSLAQFWSRRGAMGDGTLQSVETGWQVLPNRYGDAYTHFFIYFTTHAYSPAYPEGYNLDGGYFVQTNPNAIVGGRIYTISTPGQGTQVGATFATKLRGSDGTRGWWVGLEEPIGYYPISLFAATGLADQAVDVVFGGEVVTDLDARPSTTMGSGVLADVDNPGSGFGTVAFLKKTGYYDLSGRMQTVLLGGNVEQPAWYDVVPFASEDPDWGNAFFYGGPGPS